MKSTNPRVLLIAGLLAASGVLVGCSSSSQPPSEGTAAESATPEDTDSATAPASETPDADATAGLPLSADTAIDAALVKVPDGAAVSGGRTDEAGQQVWYVEVRASDGSGTEIYLNTATGKVVREQPTNLSAVASGTLPKLSAQEGLAAAVEAIPGSEVVEFDLARENGAPAWYVLVRGSSGLVEVYLNADTGAIISQERGD